MNTMLEIYLYLLKELHYNTSVIFNIQVHHWTQAIFHAVLCSIHFYVDRNQDDTTPAEHSKRITEMLKNIQLIFSCLSTIWNNNGGCSEQYRFSTKLYLLSMLAHTYNIIID